MERPTPEQARRLAEQGIFDVGMMYLGLPFGPPPKHKYWDGWEPPEERNE
jgi:hypothetical protein